MNRKEENLAKRQEYAIEAEQYFKNLPPSLNELGGHVRVYLGNWCYPSGTLKDFILENHHDYPVIDLPLWLFDDLEIPNNEIRKVPEKNIFLSSFFYSSLMLLNELIINKNSLIECDFVLLSNSIQNKAISYLYDIFPKDSIMKKYSQEFLESYLDAKLWHRKYHNTRFGRYFEKDINKLGDLWALIKIPVLASALIGEKEELIPLLLKMIDELNIIIQIKQEISGIKKDLICGNFTYPIVSLILDSRLDPNKIYEPEEILGNILFSGTIPRLVRECLERLKNCLNISEELKLERYTSYLKDLECSFLELLSIFPRKKIKIVKPFNVEGEGKYKINYEKDFQKSLKMAELYILSDRTFKESWEVHRWGFLNEPTLTGQNFPSGVIIENMCSTGIKLLDEITFLYENYSKNDLHYFNEKCPLAPDSDTLGLMIRLYLYSNKKNVHKALIERHLRWMLSNVEESGKVPVWLLKGIDPDVKRDYFDLISGSDCIGVHANLILGLIMYDYSRFKDLIEKLLKYQLNVFNNKCMGIPTFYKPLFWYFTLSEIIKNLREKNLSGHITSLIADSINKLAEKTENNINFVNLSPMDSAFLIMICRNLNLDGLLKPFLKDKIIQTQRFDGAWEAEPFYSLPTIGNVIGWHSSRLITSSFCYRAIKRLGVERLGVVS